MLASLGVEPEDVRGAVVAKYGTGDVPEAHIPFSDDVKKVLEHSLRESLSLDHTYIGTEHIALGLINDASTAEVLTTLGVRADAVRDAIMPRLSSAAGAEPAEP